MSVISVVSLYTEITVKTAVCQALFAALLCDSRRRIPQSGSAHLSLFRPCSAIYSRIPLCQSGVSEDVVHLSFARTYQRNAAIAALGALAVLACALGPLAVRATQSQANSTDGSAIASVCPVVYPDDQSPASPRLPLHVLRQRLLHQRRRLSTHRRARPRNLSRWRPTVHPGEPPELAAPVVESHRDRQRSAA